MTKGQWLIAWVGGIGWYDAVILKTRAFCALPADAIRLKYFTDYSVSCHVRNIEMV